jgi:hypothetical protein
VQIEPRNEGTDSPSIDKRSRLRNWLFPRRGTLHARARIAVGFLVNIGVALYFLLRREHLWDIRDYRYAPLNPNWIFLSIAIPYFAVFVLLPVCASVRKVERWTAIALCIFPGYLALAGWIQLILVWLG